MQSNVPSLTLPSSHSSDASNCSGEGGIGPGVALIMYFTRISLGRCGDGSSISAAEVAMQAPPWASVRIDRGRQPEQLGAARTLAASGVVTADSVAAAAGR